MKKNKIFLIYIIVFVYQICFFANSNAQIPTDGLVACYPFIGTANDMSGNNYHGTVYGATLTTDRFGIANNAYYFNGIDNYISLPFAPFNLQNFTYSVWAYATNYPAGNDQGLIISLGSYGGGISIALSNSYSAGAKGWSFNIYYPGGQYYWYTNVLPPLNTWFHLALTRDTNYQNCYINGILVNSQQVNGTIPYYGIGPYNAHIGRRDQMTLNQYFAGKIDDIHIYNRALTSSEVLLLYNGADTVTITANPGTIIYQGENITFTANINGSITNPTYQWQVNGAVVGGNSPIYSSTNLNNGDVVRCLVIPGGACEVPVYSNSLTITVNPLPNNGLVACYPFSGNANDMSGNNYNGIVHGATLTTDRFGRANNAYYFNGIDNYISLPFAPFNLQNFTYSFWAYATSIPATNDQGCVISIGSYAGGMSISYSNSYTSAKGWAYGCYYAPGSANHWAQGALPPLNTWFHLVLTRDGNYIDFYINGQLINSQQTNGTFPYYGTGPLNAHIGRRDQMNLNQYFAGKIDDIHIYNRALTSSEVLHLYNGAGIVTITASSGTNICSGDNVSFSAVINGSISHPYYQWQLNGNNVGINSHLYSNNSLANGDVVRCLVTSDQPCETPIVSNALTMNVANPISLGVNITASPGNNICKGENVVFIASGNNGGANAVYQWKINGINVGTNSNTLSVDTLTDGAHVMCLYSSLLPCTSNNPAISNIIDMMVGDSLPLDVYLTASPNNFICEGTPVIFTAHGMNGGNNANYQWMNNGVPIGSNSPTLSINIHRNDIIYCIYSSPLICVTNNPVSSGVINMVILSNPVVDAGNNSQILLPDGIYLNPVYYDGTPPYQFIWTPGNSLSNPYIANPYATPITTTTYSLSVTDAYGCIAQDSITIYVDTENEIFIPNTFSPNGDSQNDILYVRGYGIKEMEFSIYDRWGEKIFFSNSKQVGWDGAFKGNKLAPGIFAYYLRVKTYDNKTIEKKGNITLIR